MKLEYIAKNNDINKTVKEILINRLAISHKLLITLKHQNAILLDGNPVPIHTSVNVGDKVIVNLEYEEDNTNIVPKDIPIDIVYEDECYIVVNKPSGLAVHPSILHYEDSLSNGIRYYFDKIGLKKKIRPVNRIDKDTSGLVVFAKNEYVQECLVKQMKEGIFYKEYIAIIEGFIKDKSGVIDAPIARKENSIIERCVNVNGETAITQYEVIKQFEINNQQISVVKCILKTGRTHQIRVHFSYIGHPLLGDDLYGGNLSLITRQALHSHIISFYHPIKNKKVNYTASLPDDLKSILNK